MRSRFRVERRLPGRLQMGLDGHGALRERPQLLAGEPDDLPGSVAVRSPATPSWRVRVRSRWFRNTVPAALAQVCNGLASNATNTPSSARRTTFGMRQCVWSCGSPARLVRCANVAIGEPVGPDPAAYPALLAPGHRRPVLEEPQRPDGSLRPPRSTPPPRSPVSRTPTTTTPTLGPTTSHRSPPPGVPDARPAARRRCPGGGRRPGRADHRAATTPSRPSSVGPVAAARRPGASPAPM